MVRLQSETQNGTYDAIFHVGDFAYDMDSVRTTVAMVNVTSFYL